MNMIFSAGVALRSFTTIVATMLPGVSAAFSMLTLFSASQRAAKSSAAVGAGAAGGVAAHAGAVARLPTSGRSA